MVDSQSLVGLQVRSRQTGRQAYTILTVHLMQIDHANLKFKLEMARRPYTFLLIQGGPINDTSRTCITLYER